MEQHELMAWLGDAAQELTAEQIERVAAEAERISERYPDPDQHDEREAALSAVVQYLLGDTTPEDAAAALGRARQAERVAMAAAQQIGVMLVADAAGRGKSQAARRVGISRMTLLEALGER